MLRLFLFRKLWVWEKICSKFVKPWELKNLPWDCEKGSRTVSHTVKPWELRGQGAEDTVKKYMSKGSLIPKIKAQIKGVFIELEDLRNRSMRSTLIFKNIKEEIESTWEDSARVLGKLISTELDINYTDEEINMFISRVHRDSQGFAKSQ